RAKESNLLVLYSEILIDLDDEFFKYRNFLSTKGFDEIVRSSPQISDPLDNLRLGKKEMYPGHLKIVNDEKRKYHVRKEKNTAINNLVEKGNGIEKFIRLSAFKNDKRIDVELKRLREGSYTTTIIDYLECLKILADPVDRYALPSDEKIKFAFYIQPTKDDELQRGVVQPAFEHSGGGDEVFFNAGTSANTLIKISPYGQ
ncbi:MAG: hypothetical protein ABIQ02_00515, partial [Saprospiraceae bacterium]